MPRFFERSPREKQIIKISAYIIAAVTFSIIHVVLLDLISINGLMPNLLLILCVWISISEGQLIGIIAGFAIGLFFDYVSGDLIGTNALTKMIAAFIAGYFYREGKVRQTMASYRFLLAVFLASIGHNLIYYFLYIKSTEIDYISFFIKYGLAESVYTTVVSLIGMLINMPRRELDR